MAAGLAIEAETLLQEAVEALGCPVLAEMAAILLPVRLELITARLVEQHQLRRIARLSKAAVAAGLGI